MLAAYLKDKYNIISRFAKCPSIKNRRALKLLLNTTWNTLLKDSLIIACLKGAGNDADTVLYFSSILLGFPDESYILNSTLSSINNHEKQAKIDALTIYRQALLDFGMNPLEDLYFKTKHNLLDIKQ